MDKEKIIEAAPRRPDTTLGNGVSWIMDWYEGEFFLEVGYNEENGLWYFYHHPENACGYWGRTVDEIKTIIQETLNDSQTD